MFIIDTDNVETLDYNSLSNENKNVLGNLKEKCMNIPKFNVKTLAKDYLNKKYGLFANNTINQMGGYINEQSK